MKRMFSVSILKRNALAAAVICLAAFCAFAQDATPWSQNVSPLPAPTGMVNDLAGVMDAASKQQLETRLRQFKEKTGVELAVAIVRTTGERPIFDYSLAVARGWGIGSKDGDNPSALLFVAIDDRKYFTQVSRDLEDELPDGLAGNLQRQYLVPEFKRGNYGKGVADTMEAYIRTIETRSSGGATPTPTGREISGSQGMYSTFCCLVIIGVILLIIFSNRGKSRRGGGGWGGGGFGGGGSALPWIIGSAIANASSSSDWGSSSGGSDWGGGGGGDWGGFGGGGDFGGGGAGGDW